MHGKSRTISLFIIMLLLFAVAVDRGVADVSIAPLMRVAANAFVTPLSSRNIFATQVRGVSVVKAATTGSAGVTISPVFFEAVNEAPNGIRTAFSVDNTIDITVAPIATVNGVPTDITVTDDAEITFAAAPAIGWTIHCTYVGGE